ncbi:MAG: phosphatidate cytidylyltransferase [Firmicutes bacterium]|nr:phosphatidate cytidylyltransferase [Bacillota bacterium]
MVFNWEKQGTKRFVTSMSILLALTAVFLLRWATIYVFDAFVLFLAWFACYEVFRAKKLGDRGVRDYYMYPYIAISYMAFLMGVLVDTPFPFWLHAVMQVIIIAVLALYVYIMSTTDKDLQKHCKLYKLDMKREVRTVVLEYLKLILWPALLIMTLIPLNHLGGFIVHIGDSGAAAIPQLGLFALLMVFAITIFTDTFAHVVGALMRGKKLAPNISPNKHITGFVGGIFGGIVGALLVGLVMSTNSQIQLFMEGRIGYAVAANWFIIAVGAVGAILAQLGDLYASFVKRRAGIKDYGKWMPGHGGLMDRIDGLMIVSTFMLAVMLVVTFLL